MWTVENAQQRRQDVSDRLAIKQRLLAPVAWYPVKWMWNIAHTVLKRPVHQRQLAKVATAMNRHADTAFAGYTPVADDIIVAAYFKAGTNLMMNMCYQISEYGEGKFEHIQDVMPWPDAAQPKFWMSLFDRSAYNSRSGRRVIKTHLPASKVPISDNAKYIAVTRDPKDCIASGFYFFQSLVFGPATPPASVWLEHMSSPNAMFGRWDSFTASWYKRRKSPNVLFVRFESIKNDPIDTIKTIAGFLDIVLTDQAIEKIAHKTSFKEMKRDNHRFYPATQSMWTSIDGSIIRKGQVGDGEALFNTQQLQAFDSDMREGLVALGSDFPYEQYYSIKV